MNKITKAVKDFLFACYTSDDQVDDEVKSLEAAIEDSVFKHLTDDEIIETLCKEITHSEQIYTDELIDAGRALLEKAQEAK